MSDSEIMIPYAFAAQNTLLDPGRLHTIAACAHQVEELPGSLALVGVHSAGAALIWRTAVPFKRMHLFDRFDPERASPEPGLCKKKVVEFLTRADPDAGSLHLHEGAFPISLLAQNRDTAILRKEGFAGVHIYESDPDAVRESLCYFWPHLVGGGLILLEHIDEDHEMMVRQTVQHVMEGKNAHVARSGLYQTRIKKIPAPVDTFFGLSSEEC